jgi:hypothetical protein
VVSTAIVSLAAATLAINVFFTIFGTDVVTSGAVYDVVAPLRRYLYDHFFVKDLLPWARILLFGLWFAAGFIIVNKYIQPIQRRVGWLFLTFGQNSLYSYIMSAFLLFFVHLFMERPSNILLNFIVSVGSVALIWVCIRTRFLMKIIPR